MVKLGNLVRLRNKIVNRKEKKKDSLLKLCYTIDYKKINYKYMKIFMHIWKVNHAVYTYFVWILEVTLSMCLLFENIFHYMCMSWFASRLKNFGSSHLYWFFMVLTPRKIIKAASLKLMWQKQNRSRKIIGKKKKIQEVKS